MYRWTGSRVYDLVITPNGRRLAAICTQKKLHVYNFVTREKEYEIQMVSELTCISVSKDSRYILMNMGTGLQEVHLMDLATAEVVRKFSGQKQKEFMIRSCFGGADENFVVSGSEGSFPTWTLRLPLLIISRRDGIYLAQRERNTS